MKLILSLALLLAGAPIAAAQVPPSDAPPPAVNADPLCNDTRNNPLELRPVCPTTPTPEGGAFEPDIDLTTTSSIRQAPALATPPPVVIPDEPLDGPERLTITPEGGPSGELQAAPPIR